MQKSGSTATIDEERRKGAGAGPDLRVLGALGGDAFLYALGIGFLRGASFLLVPLFAHYLSVEQYGLLDTSLLTIQLGVLIISMGMPPAVVRFRSGNNEPGESALIRGSAIWVMGIASLALTAIMLGCAHLLPHRVAGISTVQLMWWILAAAFVESFVELVFAILRARREPGRFVLATVGYAALVLIGTSAALVFLHLGVFGAIGARALAFSVIALFLGVQLFGIRVPQAKIAEAGRLLRFGVPIVIAAFGWYVLQASDRYFLAHYRGMHDVGIYALGYRLTSLLTLLVVMPFEFAYGPFVFSNLHRPGIAKTMGRLFSYLLLALLLVSQALVITSRDLVQLIAPSEFANAYKATICVLPSAALMGLYYWSAAQLHIVKRTYLLAIIVAGAAVFNIFLNVLLIPRFGWRGAAGATDASFLGAVVCVSLVGTALYPVAIEWKRTVPLVLCAIALASLWWLTRGWPRPLYYAVNLAALAALPITFRCAGVGATTSGGEMREARQW